jgi:hypothetical protein
MATRELTPEEAKAMGLDPNGPPEPVDQKALVDGAESAEKSLRKAQGVPDWYTGKVDFVAPDSEEAKIADLNTKRGFEESASDAKIALLEKVLAAMQTGSLGGADEMKGAYEAAKGGDYRKAQQSAQKELKSAQSKHPWSSAAGALPSTVVGAAPTLAARLLGAGAIGTAAGALNSEETMDNPGGVAKDAAVSGAASVALQAGGEGVAKGSGLLADYMKKKLAPAWALKAAGLRGGIANRAQQIGLENEDEALALGREFLDADLIPAGGSKEAVAGRAEALRQQSGNVIGQAVQKGEMSGIPADYDAAQWAAIKPAMDATVLARTKQGGPIRDLLRALQGQAEETPGSWQKLHQTKSDLGKSINWKAQPSGAPALARQSYGSMSDDFASQLGRAAGPEATEMLAEGNKGYGIAMKAKALSDDQGLREMANQGISLKDVAAGLGGAQYAAPATGAPDGLTAAGITALMKVLRERGPALGARAADDLAAPVASGVSKALPSAIRAPEVDEETRRKVARYLGLMGD